MFINSTFHNNGKNIQKILNEIFYAFNKFCHFDESINRDVYVLRW